MYGLNFYLQFSNKILISNALLKSINLILYIFLFRPGKALEEIDNEIELRLQRMFEVKKALVKKAGLEKEVGNKSSFLIEHIPGGTSQQWCIPT